MDPRSPYLSANRGSRTKPKRPGTYSAVQVSSPVSATTSTTAADQAAALRGAQAREGLPQGLGIRSQMAYDAGGFEGVQKAYGDDWYNLSDSQRKQILDASRA